MSPWMRARVDLGYLVIVAGVVLLFGGNLLYEESYETYMRDWGFRIVLIGLARIAIGVALAYPDIKRRTEKTAPASDFKVTWDYEGLENQARDQAASELGYDLLELEEQLGRGAITSDEYEQKKKLLEGLTELKLQLGRGNISFEENHQKKKKLTEK